MLTLIVITVLLTLAAVVFYANLSPAAPALTELPTVEHSVKGDGFRHEVASIFGQPTLDGNRLEPLQNGNEIFPAMLEAIRNAEKTITFEIFVYWQGEITRQFAEALAEKARQGVAVHAILDWYGSLQMDSELVTRMREAGVELELYRPLSWYHVNRFNHRTHRRILVVDGRVGFTGGVGVAKEWTGSAQDREHFRDSHYRVHGPVVAQLQGAFNENWHKVRGVVLTGEDYFPPLDPVGSTPAMVVTSAPGSGNERARQLFLYSISAARESLAIGSPYFVPDELVLDALLQAAKRGVQIQVLVPGRSTDSQAARFASRRVWGDLIQAGVRIFEFNRTFYHSKLLIVDDYLTLIGSANFDSRSLRLNDEITLAVFDQDFALQQREVYERDLEPCKRIDYETWVDRPLRHKMLEPLALLIQGQL